MFRCIITSMDLEKSKYPIIWNGGSRNMGWVEYLKGMAKYLFFTYKMYT
jgi:hypothetical protein